MINFQTSEITSTRSDDYVIAINPKKRAHTRNFTLHLRHRYGIQNQKEREEIKTIYICGNCFGKNTSTKENGETFFCTACGCKNIF